MYNPNYRDFYQTALIPIGLKDQLALLEAEITPSDQVRSTHWLIALEGEPAFEDTEYYHWKVSIYPADSEGSFSWKHPYFSSQLFDSFNNAAELARSYASFSINDEIFASGLQEKIS
ncbi:hypothetical protein [Neobacillus terrae]|uniref:hypothetical protein n=1 Tax=Neobacillus terrae TaxID=3034837 RepID=UPI00140DF50F|nr:hypothetical protein [Neobacillus terrae]NHM29576.1 hypothetical protein [Neobacillus terrae]